jgi:hypothetical protein
MPTDGLSDHWAMPRWVLGCETMEQMQVRRMAAVYGDQRANVLRVREDFAG